MVKPPNPGYYASHPDKFREFILLQLAKDPDINKANKAKTRLLVENLGYLKYTIGEWISPGSHYDYEELLQDAKLAFLEAVDKYDISRDISIRTYARYYLLSLQRKFFKKSVYVELEDKHLEETCFQPDDGSAYADLRTTLQEAIGHLTNAEQEVINLHFFSGLKSRVVAIQRGCSEARVSTLLKSGLQKLKHYLMSKGIQPGMLNFN